jgi:hypothetical protein
MIAVLLLVVALAAAHRHPLWERWTVAQADHERLVDYEQFVNERMALNRHVTDDLVAGRLDLADAVELVTASDRDWADIPEIIERAFPAPTPAEGMALHLLTRVDAALESNPAVRPEVTTRLGDEYEALFGRRPTVKGVEWSGELDPADRAD